MKSALTVLLTALLLTSCASGPEQGQTRAGDAAAEQARAEMQVRAEQEAARAAALERERRQRELAEIRAREAEEADRRYLELETRMREEEQARRRAAAADDSAGRSSSDRITTPAPSQAPASTATRVTPPPAAPAPVPAPRAPAVEADTARQQARIAELEARIAANRVETARIDNANEALREAVMKAEELALLLTAEQEKYTSATAAGRPQDNSAARAEIERLSAELERLRALANELSGTAATP